MPQSARSSKHSKQRFTPLMTGIGSVEAAVQLTVGTFGPRPTGTLARTFSRFERVNAQLPIIGLSQLTLPYVYGLGDKPVRTVPLPTRLHKKVKFFDFLPITL